MDSSQKAVVLKAIVDKYLNSWDFNGLPLRELSRTDELDKDNLREIITALIQEGRTELNFDNLNPHIKRHAFLSSEEQIERMSDSGVEYLVAYPSISYLRETVDPGDYEGRPFTLRLALGEPQLDYVSFDLRVLEFYRNDPRYYYTTDDISGRIGSSEGMAERDEVILQSFGFSYDEDRNRAVAVFLRYLHKLNSEHQQIWNASILGDEFKLHPDYFSASILGSVDI